MSNQKSEHSRERVPNLLSHVSQNDGDNHPDALTIAEHAIISRVRPENIEKALLARVSRLEKNVCRQSAVQISKNCGLDILLLRVIVEPIVIEQVLSVVEREWQDR